MTEEKISASQLAPFLAALNLAIQAHTALVRHQHRMSQLEQQLQVDYMRALQELAHFSRQSEFLRDFIERLDLPPVAP